MKTVSFKLVGIAPLGFSRAIQSKRETGEGHDSFEERTWRERMHTEKDGTVFVPPQAMKNCLAECAKYLSETIKGKGKATWTKHFEAGLMCTDPMPVHDANGNIVKANEVEPVRVFVPSDGKRGGGSRVWKNFPVIPHPWRISGELHLLDPLLRDNTDKVYEYLEHAGQFIGIGYFRPRRSGYYGRFKVEKFDA